jgi:hypothetical protein
MNASEYLNTPENETMAVWLFMIEHQDGEGIKEK